MIKRNTHFLIHIIPLMLLIIFIISYNIQTSTVCTKESYITYCFAEISKTSLEIKEEYMSKESINILLLKKWRNYLDNRGVNSSLTKQEKEVNDYLKNLFDLNTISQEEFSLQNIIPESRVYLSSDKNKTGASFTYDNNVPFTEEDYIASIERISSINNTLKMEENLTPEDIVRLCLLSGIVTYDVKGNLKFIEEGYKIIRDNASSLGMTYSDVHIDIQEILDIIRKKSFFVRAATEDIPSGDIMSTGPLLHKSILIPYKKGFLVIGMHTSSRSADTVLSPMQESNLNIDERYRDQRFRYFSFFIESVDDIILVDLLTLGFDLTENILNQDVVDIILKTFENTASIWGNNPVEKPFHVTKDVLRRITLIFNENKLKQLENAYKELLKEIQSKSIENQIVYRDDLNKKKKAFLERKQYDKYFSYLSEEYKVIAKSLSRFRALERKEEKINAEKMKKESIKKRYEEMKKAQENTLPDNVKQDRDNRRAAILAKKALKDKEMQEKNNTTNE